MLFVSLHLDSAVIHNLSKQKYVYSTLYLQFSFWGKMARVFSRHFGLQASTIVNSHSITIIPSPSCGLQGHAADVDTGPQRRPGPAPQQQEGYPPST